MKNEIELSQQQFNLLFRILGSATIQYEVLKSRIIINESNREKVIDLISDYYSKHGIDNNFEPNKLGDEIENLLDKFISIN